MSIVFLMFKFFILNKNYENLIIKYSLVYNLDKNLVFAIVKTESNFDNSAVSIADARGLMQLMPSTASWVANELGENFNETDLFDPETNIKFGCFYLKYLFDKFKDESIVICAYNAGERIVRQWLDENGNLIEYKIDYNETKNYLKKVKIYKKIYSLF